MPDIVLGPLNTIDIPAGAVTRLKGVLGINRPVDLINLGPGTIYLRGDRDPATNDQHSLQLPANWAMNGLIVDGRIGLGIVSDGASRISVKVT